jgi:CrcB protein
MAPPLPPHILFVALGGALGAVLRHAVSHHVAAAAPNHPYLATLLVNAVGSGVLGVLAGLVLARPGHLPRELELALTVGLLGALTTYSAFATDAVKLVHEGRSALAAAYVVGTTALCLGLAGLAFVVTTIILGPAPTNP